MISVGSGGSDTPLVVGAAILGFALSLIAELLIFRLLPKLGVMPTPSTRFLAASFTGVACAAFAFRFELSATLPAFIFLAVIGVQLARIDIALHLLPNPLVSALFAGGFLLFLVSALLNKQTDDLLRSLVAALILFAAYLILAIISPAGIGMGDVKLAAPIGLYLGYLGWSHLLYGGLLGFVFNGVVTILISSLKRRNKAAEVAHGPSMLAAAAGATLFLT